MADTWKSPTSVIALVGLVISVIGNIYQYSSTEEKILFEKDKWNKEFNLEKAKLELEMEAERILREEKKQLELELQDVKAAIKVWDDALLQDNLKLTVMRNKLRSMTNAFEIDTQKKNILANEDAIRVKEKERERVIGRQNEIETLLRSKLTVKPN